jgi:heme exporter protein C
VVIELKSVAKDGEFTRAAVEVRMPGLKDYAQLVPSLDASGKPADRPEFPGQSFRMVLIEADSQAGTARVNMQAPGTGLLSNQRTLWVFLASNVVFGLLAIWIYRIRATILHVATLVQTTEAL